jgi:alpha-tubulin suppressor-like RCC1 family protein
MTSAKLVIIDTRVEDYQHFVDSLQTGVSHVLLDFYSDTYSSLLTKISALGLSSIESVALVSHSVIGTDYQMLSSASSCKLPDVMNMDPTLSSWSEWIQFWTDVGAPIIDLLGCAIYMDENWRYVLNTLESQMSVDFRASVDDTGALAVGGNWILESDNVNVKDVYFTESIEGWSGKLGSLGYVSQLFRSTYSSYIDTSGQLYAFGGITPTTGVSELNEHFYFKYRLKPTLITFFYNLGKKIHKIEQGYRHTAILVTDGLTSTLDSTNGELWVVGSNTDGQLGFPSTVTQLDEPALVPVNGIVDLSRGVIDIACGGYHTAAIKNGNVYTWGLGTSGRLGNNSSITQYSPVQVSSLTAATKIAAGEAHTVVINNGAVWTFGSNDMGQLGNNSTSNASIPVQPRSSTNTIVLTSGATHVYATLYSTAAIVNGGVWVFGKNTTAMLAQPTTVIYISYPIQPNNLSSGVTQLSMSDVHTNVIKNGTLLSCGYNFNGELGIGNNSTVPLASFVTSKYSDNSSINDCAFVTAGIEGSIIINNEGKVFFTGKLQKIMVGSLDISFNKFTYIPDFNNLFENNISYAKLGVYNHTSYIIKNNDLYGGGTNKYSHFFTRSTKSELFDFFKERNKRVQMVALGNYHAAIIVTNGINSALDNTNGELWTIGNNDVGQLGNNSNINQTVLPVQPRDAYNNIVLNSGCTHVSCSAWTTAVICNGRLYTFGGNTRSAATGMLGIGISSSGINRNYPVEPVDGSGSSTVKFTSGCTYVSCGETHTAVICNGALYTFGDNTYGQLGDGTTIDKNYPVAIASLSSGCTIVSATSSHTAVIKDKKLYSFGRNNVGQLCNGDPSGISVLSPILIPQYTNATKVYCSTNSTILINNNQVYAFGSNIYGKLGNGTTVDASRVAVQPVGLETGVSEIASSQEHTIFIKNNSIYGAGRSRGIDSSNDSNTPLYITTDTSAVKLWDSSPLNPIYLDGSITMSPITIGNTLSTGNISYSGNFRDAYDDTVVIGTFVLDNPSYIPLAIDNSASWTFTPNDLTKYLKLGGSVQITIIRYTVVISGSVSLNSINFGQTISSANINASFIDANNSNTVNGSISFDTPSTKPTSVGTFSYPWTFRPDNSNYYYDVSGSSNVTIIQTTPDISSAITTTSIALGESIQFANISGTFRNPYDSTVVIGTLAFNSPTAVPSSTGVTSYSWTFTPTDSTNYTTKTGSTDVTTVIKPPTITYTSRSVSFGTSGSASPTIVSTGGDASITYDVFGVLPSGVSLNASTGVITWNTSVLASSYSIVIRSTNSSNTPSSTTFSLTVTAGAPSNLTYSVSSSTITYKQSGNSVSPSLNNGGGGITYDFVGFVASGINIDPVTGVIRWS